MDMTDYPIVDLHSSIAHAMYQGFPDIEYETRDWEAWQKEKKEVLVKKTRKYQTRDLTIVGMFPQIWSSTALGFGGLGGQSITTAYTVVIQSEHGHGYCVYFGGRFAYRVEKVSEKFLKDLYDRKMVKVSEVGVYER